MTAVRDRYAADPRYRAVFDIAHTNNTPPSFEAARWSDLDLAARAVWTEDDHDRCPQCKLSEDAAHHVAAVIDSCPTCAARDTRSKELRALDDSAGRFVRWEPIDDPDLAMSASAWVQFTSEGAQARKRHEAGLPPAATDGD